MWMRFSQANLIVLQNVSILGTPSPPCDLGRNIRSLGTVLLFLAMNLVIVLSISLAISFPGLGKIAAI